MWGKTDLLSVTKFLHSNGKLWSKGYLELGWRILEGESLHSRSWSAWKGLWGLFFLRNWGLCNPYWKEKCPKRFPKNLPCHPCDPATHSILHDVTQPWYHQGWCLPLVLYCCDVAIIFHPANKKKRLNNINFIQQFNPKTYNAGEVS